ncbi:MAG TPA: hypothetical protein VGG10_04430 [Rhizomicrobium sp.]|jgi:hypothetical protein
MFIGDLLIAHGLVTAEDVAAALEFQKTQSGRLGDILVALGKLNAADLEAVMKAAPAGPITIAETGIPMTDLLNLTMKAMYSASVETASAVSDILKLPHRIIQLLFDQAIERKLLEVLGNSGVRLASDLRHALTERGKQWAIEAMTNNQYVGPAPVPLETYRQRILQQAISNARVDRAAVEKAFSGLIISPAFTLQIGPAINSGKSVLLYGPPGNGKTTVAERIGAVFPDVIYVPYCFQVEGQIVKVFDPGVHKSLQPATPPKSTALRREESDMRWVPCRRPFVVAGGELTLEMLDLSYNETAKFYEAPLHVKALGGIFTIDDFGRQLVSPESLLNRWIVPLDRRVDYLKLHTGKSFSLPFDELVVFSTNLSPADLMDPAFLRRIPYKMLVGAPTAAEYKQIFHALADAAGLKIADENLDSIIVAIRDRGGMPLASYQPKFIIDQLRATCKFAGVPLQFRPELLTMALANLTLKEEAPPPKHSKAA